MGARTVATAVYQNQVAVSIEGQDVFITLNTEETPMAKNQVSSETKEPKHSNWQYVMLASTLFATVLTLLDWFGLLA